MRCDARSTGGDRCTGEAWELVADESTGCASFVFGGALAPSFAPRSDECCARLAVESIAMTRDLHGVEPETLRLDVTPALAAGDARRRAAEAFASDTGMPAQHAGAAELVVEPVVRDGARGGVLADSVRVNRSTQGGEPASFTHRIDARDGRVVSRDDNVHGSDVSGNVRSLATPGTEPDTASNPEALEGMPHIRVVSDQGEAVSDANGFASMPVPVDLSMAGTTRHYPFRFRDPEHPDGTTVVLSDGLRVGFCAEGPPGISPDSPVEDRRALPTRRSSALVRRGREPARRADHDCT
jgi:hypothetical protein